MSRRCSIDADLSCDAVAHRLETPSVPKKGRATAPDALRVLCTGRSKALPLAVFSSRACLAEIGGAAHAGRRAYPPRLRAFAARASTTRRVAELGSGPWQVREAVTQVRARTRLRRGSRRCKDAGSIDPAGIYRRALRFLDNSGRGSGFPAGTAGQRKEGGNRPTRRQRPHRDTLASLVARTGPVFSPPCGRASPRSPSWTASRSSFSSRARDRGSVLAIERMHIRRHE